MARWLGHRRCRGASSGRAGGGYVQDVCSDGNSEKYSHIAHKYHRKLGPECQSVEYTFLLRWNTSLTGHRGTYPDEVGLPLEQICSLLQNVQRLLLGNTSFTIEVILEEVYIGLGWIFLREEPLSSRDIRRRSLHL